MKLSELKGKKQMKVVGKLMALADLLHGDPALDAFLESRGENGIGSSFKLLALLERDDVCDAAIDVLAVGKGITAEEADKLDVIAEFSEMLSDDLELPSFLSGRS